MTLSGNRVAKCKGAVLSAARVSGFNSSFQVRQLKSPFLSVSGLRYSKRQSHLSVPLTWPWVDRYWHLKYIRYCSLLVATETLDADLPLLSVLIA